MLKKGCLAVLLMVAWTACSISYKFNGASIDYTKVQSISIKDFPNMAPLVYAPLADKFADQLRDKYIRQTRLQLLRENGSLDLEGEITGYDFSSQAVRDGMYASMTRLTITVRVRYTNTTNPDEDFEQSFSAYREFSNESQIQQVQDQLAEEIIEEIVSQIYNATVANW
ncbi:MAG: LPS assembly lipoprotein LptE [Tannerella sp.]|jgi:hypothetical protein|nr:LPS assembly lipoprotein LptE [Tannerella sp.]